MQKPLGHGPLHWAARSKTTSVPIIQALLAHPGLYANLRDGKDQTALHIAAKDGKSELVRLLLEGGADIDVRDDVGNTALHYGVTAGQIQTIEFLVGAGASIHAENYRVLTPLDLAEGNRDLLQLLEVSRPGHQNGRVPNVHA